MSQIKIKRIDLSKDVPIAVFSASDGEQVTDSVFPGKNSVRVPAATDFDDAVTKLQVALAAQLPELSADDERLWKLLSVTLQWDKEGKEYGFSAVLSGFLANKPLLKITVKETSPEQIDDRVYAALKMLETESIKYVRGVNAQYSLFAVLGGEDDAEIELNEEDAA